MHATPSAFAAELDVERTIELLDSEDSFEAGGAAWALGDCKNPNELVIQALVEHLGDERDAMDVGYYGTIGAPSVGEYASSSLVRLNSPVAVSPLCKLLTNCKNDQTRIRALKTLDDLGQTAHDAVDQLKVHAQDENWAIRYYAIDAMVSVADGDAKIMPVLRRALGDKDPLVQSIAVIGLGTFGLKAKEALPQLIPLLDSPDNIGDSSGRLPLCVHVAMTLGKIGTPAKAALPRLEKMLKGGVHEIVVAAAFAHCRISRLREPGLDILLKELESGYGAPRAAQALGQLEYKHFASPAIKGLKNALEHPDSLVRCYAVRSLAKIAPPDLHEIISPMTKDSSSVVCDATLEVMSTYAASNPEVLKFFVEPLDPNKHDDTEYSTRVTAARALGKMGARAKSAIPVLKQCMETDVSESVREAAEKALQEILKATEAPLERNH